VAAKALTVSSWPSGPSSVWPPSGWLWPPAWEARVAGWSVLAGEGVGRAGLQPEPPRRGGVLQLGWCSETCRSAQVGLHSPKVRIWSSITPGISPGLMGPWSRTTKVTVASRASSRVVSSPMT